jgi:NAD(P)H-dependent FMN reductase
MSVICIVAISGSLRANSSNTALVHAIATIAPSEVEVRLFNSIGDLPHFSPELDGEHSPGSVVRFRVALRAADAVLICTPEYAFRMPRRFKNALN